jgi:type II secretion system protein G
MRLIGRKGFTLIELLIVVAIIGILAAIAVPNFLEAQIRARVARCKSELRNMNVAMEAYYIDNVKYPPPMDEGLGTVQTFPDPSGPGVGCAKGDVSILLTTPVANITSLPYDPFRKLVPSGLPGRYLEATDGDTCWIMSCYGPDKVDEGTGDVVESNFIMEGNCNYRLFFSQFGVAVTADTNVEYDPTNGTTSPGDVVRVGP